METTEDYTAFNAKMVDSWVEEGWEWGRPIDHATFVKAQEGDWDVVLTPLKAMPHDWLAPYLQHDRFQAGTKLLGLASGGGQQMPIFTALGADCTVLDYSDKQLESERLVAERENYEITCVKADMTQRLPFDDASFDIIFHPVSNCYIENVQPVWEECQRILKPGGLLIAGVDNGFNFLFDDYEAPMTIQHVLPFNPLKDEALKKASLAGTDGFQFSHTFDEQIAGQLRAGFQLTAAFEDFYNEEEKTLHGFPTFWATRAVKM